MALRATIYKAQLTISDLDRHYYQTHDLTLALHPSETEERLMVRLLAFALNANENLSFGKGLSSDDEATLWERDLTGAITHWIEVGLPDERLLRRAAGRSDQVSLYTYGRSEVWWQQNAKELNKIDKLQVWQISAEDSQALAAMAQRNMAISCTIQDGEVMVSGEHHNLTLKPTALKNEKGL